MIHNPLTKANFGVLFEGNTDYFPLWRSGTCWSTCEKRTQCIALFPNNTGSCYGLMVNPTSWRRVQWRDFRAILPRTTRVSP